MHAEEAEGGRGGRVVHAEGRRAVEVRGGKRTAAGRKRRAAKRERRCRAAWGGAEGAASDEALEARVGGTAGRCRRLAAEAAAAAAVTPAEAADALR